MCNELPILATLPVSFYFCIHTAYIYLYITEKILYTNSSQPMAYGRHFGGLWTITVCHKNTFCFSYLKNLDQFQHQIIFLAKILNIFSEWIYEQKIQKYLYQLWGSWLGSTQYTFMKIFFPLVLKNKYRNILLVKCN